MFKSIGKLVVRVAVDAMVLDLYHQFEKAITGRVRGRRKQVPVEDVAEPLGWQERG